MKRGTDGAPGTPEFVKSHTVWDLVASYAFSKDFDLRLNAYNLFDKDYVAAINKSGYRYTPGAPRPVLLPANFRFCRPQSPPYCCPFPPSPSPPRPPTTPEERHV